MQTDLGVLRHSRPQFTDITTCLRMIFLRLADMLFNFASKGREFASCSEILVLLEGDGLFELVFEFVDVTFEFTDFAIFRLALLQEEVILLLQEAESLGIVIKNIIFPL